MCYNNGKTLLACPEACLITQVRKSQNLGIAFSLEEVFCHSFKRKKKSLEEVLVGCQHAKQVKVCEQHASLLTALDQATSAGQLIKSQELYVYVCLCFLPPTLFNYSCSLSGCKWLGQLAGVLPLNTALTSLQRHHQRASAQQDTHSFLSPLRKQFHNIPQTEKLTKYKRKKICSFQEEIKEKNFNIIPSFIFSALFCALA